MKNNKVLGMAILIVIVLSIGVFWWMNKNKNVASLPSTQNKSAQGEKQTNNEKININKISYISFDPAKDPGHGNVGLYLSNPDGSEAQLVYKLAQLNYSPSYVSWDWSPDNRKVAIAEVVFDLDTKKETKLPSGGCYNWSPDGKHILYNGLGGISVMGADGKNPQTVPDSRSSSDSLCRGVNDNHHWLSNSNEFVWNNFSGVYKFNLATGIKTKLYDAQTNNVMVLSVTVSSKNQIAFVVRPIAPAQANENDLRSTNIYLTDADGHNLQKLTDFTSVAEQVGQIAFTSDAEKIIFGSNNIVNPYGISVLNISDKTITGLEKTSTDGYTPPSVSTNGLFISYDAPASTGIGQDVHVMYLGSGKEISVLKQAVHSLWTK